VCVLCKTVAGTQIGLPQFSRSSFIAYQTIRDALFTVNIRLVFKATSPDDGILLYNAYNSSGFGDFIALSLRDQHVVFQFDTGAGLECLCNSNVHNYAAVLIGSVTHLACRTVRSSVCLSVPYGFSLENNEAY